MLLVLTLVARAFDVMEEALPAALEAVAGCGAPVKATQILGDGAIDIMTEGESPAALRRAVAQALERREVDTCVQPSEGRRKRLLVADMDSTIIACECLDELADIAGLRAEISAVTARAMAGEIAFEGALIERVGRLKGLQLTALQRVYDERVALSAGARTLATTMRADGARCVLVSGGFDFFTSRVARAAGFGENRGNTLIDDGARLTGEIGRPILGREGKLEILMGEAAGMGIDLAETLAVGDGANDVAMIQAAGLGVAYRAHPVLAAAADARVDHTDLTALLYFQGYGAESFVA